MDVFITILQFEHVDSFILVRPNVEILVSFEWMGS